MFSLQKVGQAIFLALIVAVTLIVYHPGLEGGFLFDDYPNLSPMGDYGDIDNWNGFKRFVISGFSGPTGRPLSLATFLINDNTWPSDAASFKYTNLLIHILVGLVLGWATLFLMRLWGMSERTAVWIALLNMAIWLLHPHMVSTTLYIVQRMAQLATLFMLTGLLGYLYGRSLLKTSCVKAHIVMSLSVMLGTALAVVSKENGALLPLLILVVEFCSPQVMRRFRPDWRWFLLFLWLPSLVVLGYLISKLNFHPDIWPTRPFNQVERLMSQGRILWEYIYLLLLPSIESRGLFQDGIIISRGWFDPVTTCISAAAWAVVTFLAFALRQRWPAFSLAVLFFLAAHLVESSVIGLELYFEHRNYMASVFLFLPLVIAAVTYANKSSWVLVFLVCGAALLWLASFTWQRATLWGNTAHLQSYWALSSPESARAQNHLATQLFRQGRIEEGLHFLEDASNRLSGSSLLTAQLLLQRVQYGLATEYDFKLAEERLIKQQFDAQTLLGLRVIAESLARKGTRSDYRQLMIELLEVLEAQPHYNKVSTFYRLAPYLKGLIYLAEGNLHHAVINLSLAINRYADIDAALAMVARVASAGHPKEAMNLLVKAEQVYSRQSIIKLKNSKELYDSEIQRLKVILLEEIGGSEK